MNHASDCHEIPDCPGIFVDAFRGHYLTQKTKDRSHVFILSHYHGDHYGSLPREGSYQGPAKIHCTPITAALLIRVHGVHESLVVAHEVGETWTAASTAQGRQETPVHITFYDANHCPGAAIILFQADNGKVHLHTGDMRYHQRMQSYPLLSAAALNRKVDTVLLDTTYAHPKHSFLPQEEAVHQIASQVVDFFRPGQPKTLVLLSCYSIGKEKVLHAVVKCTGKLIYANKRKRNMLECIQTSDDNADPCLSIIEHCTDDPSASDVHIIPMGLAGKMWPFFQPDYKACLEYAQKQTHTKYERVVAFIPSGWADASNWNKKNACKTIVREDVTISVRLVAYSEHSTFDELQQMVDFLQPRQVIPTVFSDSNDRRKIQARFRVDRNRAKAAFFESMRGSSTKTVTPEVTNKPKVEAENKIVLPMSDQRADHSLSLKTDVRDARSTAEVVDLLSDSKSATNFDSKKSCKRSQTSGPKGTPKKRVKQADVESLVAMGFSRTIAMETLLATGSDIAAAIDRLLRPSTPADPKPLATRSPKAASKVRKSSPSKVSGLQSIRDFFAVKKT